MYVSVIARKAEAELNQLVLYVESEKAGFGLVLLSEFEQTVLYIRQFPKAAPVRRNRLRHIVIGRFPVLIIYEFFHNKIHIIRVIHAARRPALRYKK